MTLFVHKKIKRFRLENNFSQKKLAAKLGISASQLSFFESGRLYPSTWHIARLNELGANIHPFVFSPVIQKLTAANAKRKAPSQHFDPRYG